MTISVDKAVIAKLIRGGKKFEVLVDPAKALDFKNGKDVLREDLLASEEVYEDSSKGLRASGEELTKTFGTSDAFEIVKKIIKEGDVQVTAEQRKEMLEKVTKRISNIISRQGVNPQTGAPHPPERILRAMDEARVKIDYSKDAESQVDSIMKAIAPVIPIRFEKVQIGFNIPSQFSGKASSVIRKLGTVVKEEWKNDGSYLCMIEMPAGLQQEAFDKVNSLTHGQAESKIIKRITL